MYRSKSKFYRIVLSIYYTQHRGIFYSILFYGTQEKKLIVIHWIYLYPPLGSILQFEKHSSKTWAWKWSKILTLLTNKHWAAQTPRNWVRALCPMHFSPKHIRSQLEATWVNRYTSDWPLKNWQKKNRCVNTSPHLFFFFIMYRSGSYTEVRTRLQPSPQHSDTHALNFTGPLKYVLQYKPPKSPKDKRSSCEGATCHPKPPTLRASLAHLTGQGDSPGWNCGLRPSDFYQLKPDIKKLAGSPL